VPAFLRLRGLVKQHIDSFNYFINREIKEIVRTNALITSDVEEDKDEASKFFFKFTDIRVGMPVVKEDCVTH
jgi:DNA-directed RNA polymerase III subunit RPC2